MKSKEKEKNKKEVQLDFGLKDTPKNIYFKYKDQYELWLAGLETRKYIKDPLTWLTIILSVTLLFTQIYMIETNANIPSKIPILNYFSTPSKRLLEREYIYMYPGISLFLLTVSIYISTVYYHKERALSKEILITMLLVSFSICLVFLNLIYSF